MKTTKNTKPAPLPTENEAWGFWGTCYSWSESANGASYASEFTATSWQKASRHLIDDLGLSPELAREFLDSRMGRHFADAWCTDGIPAWLENTVRRFVKDAQAEARAEIARLERLL